MAAPTLPAKCVHTAAGCGRIHRALAHCFWKNEGNNNHLGNQFRARRESPSIDTFSKLQAHWHDASGIIIEAQCNRDHREHPVVRLIFEEVSELGDVRGRPDPAQMHLDQPSEGCCS